MTKGKTWKARAIALAALIVSSALADAVEPFVTAEGRLAGAYQDDVDAAFVKDAEDERLVDAIRTVAAGGTAFSPEIEALIRSDPHPPELTERQRKILDATSKGLSSDQIADRLGISTYAVNQHLDAIRRKLGAQSRTEAVAIAIRKQFLKV